MQFDFKITLELGPETLGKLEHLISTTKGSIMAALDNLTTEVSQVVSVQASAVALLQGLKAKLDEAIAANAANDPSKLDELSASLDSSTNALADAVAQNTPAASTEPAPAEPAPVEPEPDARNV